MVIFISHRLVCPHTGSHQLRVRFHRHLLKTYPVPGSALALPHTEVTTMGSNMQMKIKLNILTLGNEVLNFVKEKVLNSHFCTVGEVKRIIVKYKIQGVGPHTGLARDD